MTTDDRGEIGPAIRAMVAAMLLIAIIDNYVVVIAEEFGLWQFQFTRSLMAIPVVLLAAWIAKERLRPQNLGRVIVRSIVVSIGLMIYFGTLAFLPIAQAIAGFFTAPIFVLIFGVIFLGQRIGPIRIFAAGLGFAGAIIALEPFESGLSVIAILPIIAAAFYATSSLLTRHWVKEEGTLLLTLAYIIAMGVLSGAGLIGLEIWQPIAPDGPDGFVLRGWAEGSLKTWGLVLMQAVGSVVAVGLIISAYQRADPGYVSIFEYSVLVFAPLWAWLVFGETLQISTIVGMAMIGAAGVLISLRSRS